MIILSCKNVCKSYGIDEILKDITFNINEGDKVGLIGANGAGKSTLFKILTGELQQDSGEVYIDKNKTVGYLSQHLSLDSNNSLYEEALTVFQPLIDLENKIKNLEQKLAEPYDAQEDYHNKIIKDYTLACDLFEKEVAIPIRVRFLGYLQVLASQRRIFQRK